MKTLLLAIVVTFLFGFSAAQHSALPDAAQDRQTRYIDVTFANPSLHFISAYVKGPKPGGGHFSYGLNFAPLQKKKERWTIGTRLYREDRDGHRELLYELTAADEGQVVKLKLN